MRHTTKAERYFRVVTIRIPRIYPRIYVALIVVLMFQWMLPATQHVVSAPNAQARYFAPTGYSVGGAFLQFFDRHGGVRIFGYPISGEITENGRIVQYFERQRFEWHQEMAGSPYEILLGTLGLEIARGRVSLARIPRSATPSGGVYIPETGHSLGEPFRSFWQANGGVRILGYPISESAVINGLLTQYFERARLEYHPQKSRAGYGIELGHLGREYVQARPEVAALIAAGPKPGALPEGGSPHPLTPREARLIELVNSGRVSAGLAPVTLDSGLMRLALSRSTDMATRNYYSHITPEGKDFIDLMREARMPFKFAGEVLSKNNHPDQIAADRTYTSWMGSPSHHDIIMDPRYRWVGVGEAGDGEGYRYFTMIFVQR
jgi:uncharacterized protein YkwD